MSLQPGHREADPLFPDDAIECLLHPRIIAVVGASADPSRTSGLLRQQALKDAAGTMRLLGPNTIGFVNLNDRITLSASGALELDDLPAGNIAVVSQSGGILGSLLSRAAARGIGFSKLIATSNEVDLEVADFVAYLAGRSTAGAAAASSHTGALAGADRMYDALFARAGILRAQTFGELLDIPAALATGRRLKGRRIAILTSTGGAGTLIADNLGMAGFETPAPDAATAAALRALQDNDQAVLDRNPIDVTLAGLRPDLLRGAIGALNASPTYDGLVVVVGSSALAMPALVADAIHDSLPGSDKPLIAYVSPHAPEVTRQLGRRGVPAITEPQGCTAAISALQPREGVGARLEDLPPLDLSAEALAHGVLDEHEAKRLFARAGIAAVRETVVHDGASATAAATAYGNSVVLKLLSRTITHKSEVGGVAVGVAPEDVAQRLSAMRAAVFAATGTEPDAWLVQEQVTGGVEMILGLQRDAVGTAILLGMGGVTAELFADTALRLLPPTGALTRAEAMTMAKSLKTWPLLDGYRGRPPADVPALIDAIVAFSCLAAALGDRLVTAEINPLFVLERGRGVRAADGVAVLS